MRSGIKTDTHKYTIYRYMKLYMLEGDLLRGTTQDPTVGPSGVTRHERDALDDLAPAASAEAIGLPAPLDEGITLLCGFFIK